MSPTLLSTFSKPFFLVILLLGFFSVSPSNDLTILLHTLLLPSTLSSILQTHMSTSSMLVMLVVAIISFSTFLYSLSYMQESPLSNRLSLVTLSFSLSMLMVASSKSFFTLLLSWDLLGLSSYFLVLHYLSPVSSPNAKITLYTNRSGDMFFIFTLLILLATPSSLLTVSCGGISFFTLTLLLILLTSFTKSSQFPFTCWLPQAMSAPTPVSSLVHSSTLVTGGYFFLFFTIHHFPPILLTTIQCLSGLSLMLSAGFALTTSDAKKLVAFSTMSQISLLIYCLSLSILTASLFHMVSHAFFKSSLFMLVGGSFAVHSSSQDYRYLGFSTSSLSGPLLVSVSSLMGSFFTTASLSKEMIMLSITSTSSLLHMSLFFLAALSTVAYTMRLFSLLLSMTPSPTMSHPSLLMITPSMITSFMALVLASASNSLLLSPSLVHVSTLFFLFFLLSIILIMLPPQSTSSQSPHTTGLPSSQVGLFSLTITSSSLLVAYSSVNYVSSSINSYLEKATTLSLPDTLSGPSFVSSIIWTPFILSSWLLVTLLPILVIYV